MRGPVHKNKTMFLREHVGDATGEKGRKYELSFVNMHTPAILSKQTGKYFTLSWQDILELAVEAGIDTKEGGK